MIYLLDTNAVSDILTVHPQVSRHAAERLAAEETLGLCRPVHYELLRGLLWRKATGKHVVFQRQVLPLLTWITLSDIDWEQAADFWATARRKGRQLGDPDLLLAALAYRLDAVVVSNDADFDALPIKRQDWRQYP